MRLEGKVVLISGGARGQGAVEAKLFSSEGARVVIADVLEDEGRQVEAEINENGGECLFLRLDVTSEANWQEVVAATVDRFGKLDVLINNAGIYRTERVEETTEELWDQVMEVNGKGVFLGTKCAIPEMRRAGGGSIINISSVAGLVGSQMSAAYGSSKGAVRIFTKATAIQYAGDGIRANSIHPGIIETPMTEHLLAGRRTVPGTAGPHPPWPDWTPGGRGLRRPVPGLGRVLLRNRQRVGDRRRAHGDVTTPGQR